MTVIRKIVECPIIFKNGEHQPDITTMPAGVSWSCLGYDYDNGKVAIEIYSCDHQKSNGKATKGTIDAWVASQPKMKVLATHPNSKTVLLTIYDVDGKTILEEG